MGDGERALACRESSRTVALVRGESRRENVGTALAHVADQVKLDGVRQVLIKPNCVSVGCPFAATQVDTVRAVLDFVRARYDGPITVAEGTALSPTLESFRGLGYEPLTREYGIELADLNTDDTVPVRIYDRHLRPLTVYLARTAVEADFRISVGVPKMHDTVIVTLAIKNLVMGALVNPGTVRRTGGVPGLMRRISRLLPRGAWYSRLAEWSKGNLLGRAGGSSKMAMHQGIPILNLNLALVAPHVWPHLAVIDGWQGMEGEGPGEGDPVDWRVALAGTDPLAADVLTTHLMGFDPAQVGYLHYCRQLELGVGELGQIKIVGNVTAEEARRAFTPHPAYERQLGWHLDGAEQYLGNGRK